MWRGGEARGRRAGGRLSPSREAVMARRLAIAIKTGYEPCNMRCLSGCLLAVAWLTAVMVGLTVTSPAALSRDEAVSEWSAASHSSVRLVAGGRNADGVYRVGVEIEMRPGFKTYWRVPGDAGVPPSFDWSGSGNMGSVAVRWPAPKRYVDDGVTTIGYKNRVIFPVLVRGADTGKAVTLDLKLDYAVCERICIPAKAAVSLTLPTAEQTSQTAALDSFRAQTPRVKEPGKRDDRLGLVSASFITERGKGHVEITVAQPAPAALHDAFLEGPDGWHFGAPQRVSTEADRLVLRLPVEERPKNVVGMVPVVLTLTGQPHASEIRFDIQANGANGADSKP
jgi:suppressor for copper-sensitivity B